MLGVIVIMNKPKIYDFIQGVKMFALISLIIITFIAILGMILFVYLFPQPPSDYKKNIYSIVIKNALDNGIDAEIFLGRDEALYDVEEDIKSGENRKINISTQKDSLENYGVPYNIVIDISLDSGERIRTIAGYFVENQSGLELVKIYQKNSVVETETFDIYDRANWEYNMTLRRHYKNQNETSWFSAR